MRPFRLFPTAFPSLCVDFAEDDFKSFLLKVLTAEHKREAFRSENEIFCWLKQQGLCFNKLPKFLEGGSLEFLGV